MMHPWADRRVSKSLTQEKVADLLHLNRQTVIRLEQGMFAQPSEEILGELSILYDCPIGDLIKEYNDYVVVKREEFSSTRNDFKWLRSYQGIAHPLRAYREDLDLSRLAFCRELCLDYGPIADYEENKQRGLPASIKRACNDMRWDYAPLESAVSEWRVRCR